MLDADRWNFQQGAPNTLVSAYGCHVATPLPTAVGWDRSLPRSLEHMWKDTRHTTSTLPPPPAYCHFSDATRTVHQPLCFLSARLLSVAVAPCSSLACQKLSPPPDWLKSAILHGSGWPPSSAAQLQYNIYRHAVSIQLSVYPYVVCNAALARALEICQQSLIPATLMRALTARDFR